MSEQQDKAGQDPVMEQARHWFVLLQDQAETRDDAANKALEQARFTAWLAAAPAHQAAWARVQQLWARLDVIVPVLRQQHPAPAAPRYPTPPITRRVWLQRAAAIAVTVGTAGYALTHPGLFAGYRTARGDRRTVTLTDGSVVELGSDTAMSVTFARTSRHVTLYDGDAFFTVAADADRPFIVEAAGGEIIALGTAFDVRRRGDDVTVAVTEHAVRVTAEGGELTVDSGEQVSYGGGGLGSVRPADPMATEAWRHDRLFFDETPLRDAIAEIERYRSGSILITDEAIAEIPVTGMFHARETEAALQTIADTLPVRITRLGGLVTLIRPK
ncbi:MAG: FecR family protein [Dongiaceae bacterium]